MLVILEIKFDLVSVDTAVSVDLVDCDLCAVLNCETIYSSCTCYRADTTDLEYLPEAAVLSPAAAVVASAAAAVVVSVVEEELPHAVKDAAIAIARPRLKNLFFIMFPPLELVIMITIHCFVNLKWNG